MAAIDQGKTWIFEQLSGDRRILVLSGWSAPFGRPRDKPVAETPIEVRSERVYYPGSDSPTRHVFGHRFLDLELTGRLRDRVLGAGGALAKKNEVTAFVADKQPVSVTWGDVFKYVGFIKRWHPKIEAEKEIPWEMTVEVDGDETSNQGQLGLNLKQPPSPSAILGLITLAMFDLDLATSTAKIPGTVLDLVGSLFDVLTNAVGAFQSVADQIGDFKSATFAQLNSVASNARRAKQATVALRDTFCSLPLDAATLRDSAREAVKFLTAQVSAETTTRQLLDSFTEAERSAAVTKAGRVLTTYVARDGDSWEGISMIFYFDPSRGNDVRAANEVPAGESPVAGVEYVVPK